MDKKLKFKVKLHKDRCRELIGDLIETARIRLERRASTMYNDLENKLVEYFKDHGLKDGNFEVGWIDDDTDFIRIKDNESLEVALDEMKGDIYNICVHLKNDEKTGMVFHLIMTITYKEYL